VITPEILRDVDLFKDLTPAELAKLQASAREETYKKDETIFREKDPATKLYIILTGVVEIARPSRPEGRTVRLLRLARGEVFGELAMLDEGVRSASAIASIVPETHIASWTFTELSALFDRDPVIGSKIHRALARKLASRLRLTSEAVFALLQGVLGKHL